MTGRSYLSRMALGFLNPKVFGMLSLCCIYSTCLWSADFKKYFIIYVIYNNGDSENDNDNKTIKIIDDDTVNIIDDNT